MISQNKFHPIPGYPMYQVDRKGQVFSLHSDKFLSQYTDTRGYRTVALEQATNYVHRLVLVTFVGPRPEGMECLHLDGDPGNNNLPNLRWGTHKENATLPYTNGRPSIKGRPQTQAHIDNMRLARWGR